MRNIIMCVLLVLWATGSLPSEASAQSLLQGATASSHTIPPGWTKVLAQGFEGGAVTYPQYVSSGITTAQAHSGTHSTGGSVTSDGGGIRWNLEVNQMYADHFYISAWEYLSPNFRQNLEMFLFHFRKEQSDGVQHIILDWFNEVQGAFNSTLGDMVIETEGTIPNYTNKTYYTGNSTIPVGAWHQWEVDIQVNTPGQANGRIILYLDGVLFKQWVNQNFVNVSMQGSRLQVGGTYTVQYPFHPPKPPLSCGTFFGDGIIDNTSRCSDFNNCPCIGVIPIHQRYLDDIIVMRLGGSDTLNGGGPVVDTTPPTPPTAFTVQ